jgi:opacity protein-like surface antigen
MRRTFVVSALALAFALALALPGPAVAQTAGFELIPFAGYRTDGTIEGSYHDHHSSSPHLKVAESDLYGVAFDVPLTGGLKLELMVNRQDSALKLDPGFLDPEIRLGDLSITYAHVGVLWQWRLGQVQPYVVASAGLARLDPQGSGLSAEDHGSASLGGGVKVFLTPNFGLRFEGRGYAIDLNDSFRDCNDCGRYDDYLYQAEGTAGVVFSW